MSSNERENDLKLWRVVVLYEGEVYGKDEFDAHVNIRLGNTIVENATIVPIEQADDEDEEIEDFEDFKERLRQARIEARRQAAIRIVLKQLAHKTKDYSLRFNPPKDLESSLDRLSLEQLETLSIDSLQMNSLDDLKAYLAAI